MDANRSSPDPGTMGCPWGALRADVVARGPLRSQRRRQSDGLRSQCTALDLQGSRTPAALEATPTVIIRSIEFVGNKKYTDKVLQQRIGIELGERHDPFLAEGGRRTIIDIYHTVGHTFVEVTVDKDLARQGRLVYTITEGPRVKIQAIRFVGNKAFGSGTLHKLLKTKQSHWLIMPGYYSEQTVRDDAEKLRNFYYNKRLPGLRRAGPDGLFRQPGRRGGDLPDHRRSDVSGRPDRPDRQYPLLQRTTAEPRWSWPKARSIKKTRRRKTTDGSWSGIANRASSTSTSAQPPSSSRTSTTTGCRWRWPSPKAVNSASAGSR